MTTPATPATKIVIVSGQEFSVPADAENEAIREQLKAAGFPDVAAATVQAGKKTIDGVEYQTIEFVKKAGTKGLDGAELAELLGKAPPKDIGKPEFYGPTSEQRSLLLDLVDGQMTFADVLEQRGHVVAALQSCYEAPSIRRKEGAELCSTIDALAPVASSASCDW